MEERDADEDPPVSEQPQMTLRLPPSLRHALLREANVNGRSLNSEITLRLKASMADRPPLRSLLAREEPSTAGPASDLGEPQRRLLSLYARLTTEQQLALLTFLKLGV